VPTSPIGQILDTLRREKNIDQNVILAAIEEAVVEAARAQFNAEQTGAEFRARCDPETADVEVFVLMVVVDEVHNHATEISLPDTLKLGVKDAQVGDRLEFAKPNEELGRIAAEADTQIILERVRELERENIYNDYIDRIGELVNGPVKRFERGDVVLDFDTTEAVILRAEQSPRERFSQGERITALIKNVHKHPKGPQIELSRTAPELLIKLFEREVDEIYDGKVVIKAAVREAGVRAKIAVASTERDVDPVGACVGLKGLHVQAVMREIRGERIDVVEWSAEPAVFAANALLPAKVSRVELTSVDPKHLTVTVPDDQLSLAYGNKSVNLRLAAELVGWRIDIHEELTT
jgi:N utilization substance protein A